jgi:hypothetical protein
VQRRLEGRPHPLKVADLVIDVRDLVAELFPQHVAARAVRREVQQVLDLGQREAGLSVERSRARGPRA